MDEIIEFVPRKSDVLLQFPSGGEGASVQFWVLDGKLEILRLCANGDIYVRGQLAANDKEVVEALREFLVQAGHIRKDG